MALTITSTEINELGQARLTAWTEWNEPKWGKVDEEDVEFYAEMVCTGLRAETGRNVVLHKDDEGNWSFRINDEYSATLMEKVTE